uniref:PIK-related kinase FAT domain-containing protein n=2 Tax=Schistocephalus solidus TaxID=70667 RepID=A0A0X3PBM4_SCHSO
MLTKIKGAYANLFNSELALEERLNSGTELCELLENASVDSELKDYIYEIFINIQHFLTETQPQFIKESPVQRLRHICLEILQKIRNVDFFKPYAPSLISLLFKLIEHENEENVLLCIKLIIDLHKFYRPQFSSDVTQFLVFVQKVYRSLKGQSFNIFRPQENYEVDNISDLDVEILLQGIFTPTPVKTKSTDSDGNFIIYHILPKSCLSLRVMQEIPILVVLMYQLFKQQIHHDVSEFIPLIMEFINMKPLPEQRLDPAFRQDKFIDFLAAQVKTLSFLAYVIKIYQDLVEQHSTALVKGMMNLLVTCPPSVTNMRKEFFIAARHILGAQEIRPKFLSVLDDLMREDILIGQGYTVHDALRPLAYSTLADLTHHLRSELSLTKIARAIDLYGRNMFDDSLPFSIQQMSLKLLLNLVECVRQRAVASTATWAPDSAAGGAVSASSKWSQRQISTATARRLLLQIMRLCVLKCQIIAEHLLPEIEAKCMKEDYESSDGGTTRFQPKSSFTSNSRSEVTAPRDAMDTDDIQPNARPEPFLTSEVLTQGQLTFTDLRALTKSLATGMRTVVTSLTQCPHWNSPLPQALRSSEDYAAAGSGNADELGDLTNQPSPKLLQPAEVAVLFDYLTHGLRMLDVLRIVSKDGQLFLRGPQSGAKYPDERFLLETVAMTFVPLSPISFREIFSGQIGYIVEWCRKSPLFYTNFAFHLLSQLSQTSNFGHILLNFLVDRLEKLGDGTDESFIHMRLLKLCFNSVNMSGTENEHVMRLFLRRIVQGSMQYCLEAREPTAYLTLLRTLFRSIGGGAHDKLYREFFPLLPEMLTTLNRLLRSAHRASARDLLSELCVIVPVRLSALLPYLSLLMEPLIYVLNCNTVSQGLRTLELCVENMQPDFLYEHMHQVRGDMLLALYNSLHSQSEYVQKMAFKVLGKLGRYNRADIGDVQRLNLDVGCGEAGPLLRFWLIEYPNRPVDLPIRTLVDAAVETVQDGSMDRPVRLRAWNFLKGVCVAALNLHPLVNLYEEMASVPYLQSLPTFPLTELSKCILASESRNEEPDPAIEDRYAKDINREVILRAVGGVFLGASIQPPFEGSGVFMTFLIRQLTLVNLYDQIVTSSLQDTDSEPMKPKQSQSVDSSDQLLFPPTPTAEPSLDPKLVVDAICLVMGHEDKEHVSTGYVLLDEMLSTVTAAIRAALQTDTAMRPMEDEPKQRQPEEHSSVESVEILSERALKCLVRFQLLRHLSAATMDMLYHPAWYVKWGACCILLHLCKRLPIQWFIQHIRGFLRGLLHCLHDLSSQMGQGALNLARECALELMKLVFLQEKGPTTNPESATITSTPHLIEGVNQQQALRVALIKLPPSQPSEGAFPPDADLERLQKTEPKGSPTESKVAPALREPSKRTAAVRRRTGQRKALSSVTTVASKRGSARTISRESSPPDHQPSAAPSLPPEEPTADEIPPTFKVKEQQTVHFVPSPLMDSVLPELVDALLSEAKAVRVEARRLLRIIAAFQKVTLTDLLKPYVRLISDWLPPKNRQYRLANLPISSQVAVIETNYFLCQPEDPEMTPKGPLSPEEAISDDVGASLLRYCPTRRCDHRFLIDLRAILDAPWPLPTAAGAAGTQAASVLAFGGFRGQLGGGVSAPSISSALASQTPLLSFLHQQQIIDLKVAACRVLSTTHYIDSQKSSTLAALFKGICSDSPAIHKMAFDCIREFVSHTTIDLELRHTYVKPILQNIRQVANLRLSTIRQLAYCAELFPSTFSERFCDAIHCHLNAFVELISNRPEAVSKFGASQQPVELASALIDLFHLIPLATEKYVGILIGQVIRMEQLLNIEFTSPLRLPLVRSLVRYPEETFRQFLHGPVWPYDSHAHRLLLFAVTCSEGLPLVTYLESHVELLADVLKISDTDSIDVTLRQTTLRLPRSRGPLTRACPRHLALRLLHTIHQQHPTWFTAHLDKAASPRALLPCSPSQSTLLSIRKEEDVDSSPALIAISALLTYWSSAEFFRSQSSLTLVQLQQTAPGVDVEALLEEEHMSAGAGSTSNNSRKSSPFHPGTTATLLQAESPAAAGVRISAGLADHSQWDEPFLILDCLLPCAQSHPDDFDLLFTLVVGMARLRCVGYNRLRRHVQKLAFTSTPAWHRKLFLSYVSLVKRRVSGAETSRKEPEVPLEVSTSSVASKVLPLAEYLVTPEAHFKLLAHLILPCVQRALEQSPQEFLLGRPPNPCVASDEDLVHLFVSVLLTDDAVNACTGLRIMYYQLASLFIYYAPEFVHDVESETQSYRLRSITSFAWPCVSSSLSVVDLQEKYTGLQVLAHIIAKFPVAKKVAPQVFQCLAKGTHIETKKIVNPVLDMLLPAWVTGPEELKALAFSTKKIMMEDHGIQSCVHILSLIVRHGDLYYPIRHHVLSLIIVIITRLSAQQLPIDQRRLILDMIDTAFRWHQKSKAEANESAFLAADGVEPALQKPLASNPSDTYNTPMEKTNRDQLTNLMIRFACQSIDTTQNGTTSELSARRALSQIETTLSSEVWGGETCELRLSFLDRFLCPDEFSAIGGSGSSGGQSSGQSQAAAAGGASGASAIGAGGAQSQQQSQSSGLGPTQSSSVFMTLEVLRVIYTTLESPTLLSNVKYFSKSVSTLLSTYPLNVRLTRACANLIRALLIKYPADASNRQKITSIPELVELYTVVLKTVHEALTFFGDNTNKTAILPRLQSAFLLLTATQQCPINPYAFVDRCISQIVKLLHRLIHEVVTPTSTQSPQDNTAFSQLTDLLISGLDIVKSRLNVVSNEARKNIFGPDLLFIIERSKEAKLLRAVIRILRDWIDVPKTEEHFAPSNREKVAFFSRLWMAVPRWSDQPEVVRDILDCIYQVFSNNAPKNHDIMVKLEQAFCCSLLTPLPDLREKFIDLFLTGSNLISLPLFGETGESTETSGSPKTESTANAAGASEASVPSPSPVVKSDLLIRLLFLLVSNSWDEAHFKDGFWLPLFFDVLLCTTDFSKPTLIVQSNAKFCSPDAWSNKQQDHLVQVRTVSDPNADAQPAPKPEPTEAPSAQPPLSDTDFHRLLDQQSSAFAELKSTSAKDTIRGVLNLVHRRQALATELFGQLWHCIWHRLLLNQSERRSLSSRDPPDVSQLSDTLADTVLSAAGPLFSVDSSSLLSTEANSPTATTVVSCLPLGNGTPMTGASPTTPVSLSPGEIRGFLLPQLVRFVTSDEHVNPTEAPPSPLGSFISGLYTTPDSLLLSMPLPLLSYIGYAHNQWYAMALFFESLCARGYRALAYNGRNSSVDNDLTYSIGPAIDGSGAASGLPEDVPLGTAALSLVALYDCMADPDHFVAAWWYRLNSNCAGNQRITNVGASAAGITTIPDGESAPTSSTGLLCPAVGHVCDFLRTLLAFSRGDLYRGLETATNLLVPCASSVVASFEEEGWRRAGVAGSIDSLSFPSPSSLAQPTGLSQFSELINKTRMQEYCIRTLKLLGQWENLESLAATSHSTLSPVGLTTSPVVGPTAGGGSGNSTLWGLRAEAAWRLNDWSEVYTSLAGLANECPRQDQWRFALIQAAACVAGRRAALGLGALDFDAYSSGSLGVGGSAATGGSSVSAPGSGTTVGAAATAAASSAGGISGLLQAAEGENHRVMLSILREWRCLPLIVSNQHVRLLQAFQRAIEVTEGNILLIQHCGQILTSSSGSAGVTPGAPSVISAARTPYDYKTVFRSWLARPPLISDDLSFWSDLLSWRQVVFENIINCGASSHKFGQERTNLLTTCQRELALCQIQLARGYRKNRLPSLAQQNLDRYSHLNFPPLFEKTKQDIKLKLADLRKEELLEGLELMEKTNIQQFEKKDKARFFCYKAVFFSHFNKGDEATKNFGYATQMQDNLHKVWSVYGDFLENVYSSYPAAKREIAVSTTGIFAMQALMEAATVAGTSQHLSHSDLAKCIWLLTLDDAGDAFSASADPSSSSSVTATNNTPSVLGQSATSQQRLARTFEERAGRVHPDALLPWLPSLAVCLLRPEGRFVSGALRNLLLTYPTALYSALRGLQHQLTTEMERDRRIAVAFTSLSPESRQRLDEVYVQNPSLATTTSVSSVAGNRPGAPGTDSVGQRGGVGGGSLSEASAAADAGDGGGADLEMDYESCSGMPYVESSGRRSTVRLGTHGSEASAAGAVGKPNSAECVASSVGGTSAAVSSMHSASLIAKRTKKTCSCCYARSRRGKTSLLQPFLLFVSCPFGHCDCARPLWGTRTDHAADYQ